MPQTASPPRLILGSGSPRRRELLATLGVRPAEIRHPDVDETPQGDETPRAYCARVTEAKARALPPAAGEVVLCADTTVAVGRRILGKPADAAEAAAFLALLEGRRHRVITCVALHDPTGIRMKCVETRVKLRRLGPDERARYLAGGEWRGKAGGYAIQGAAAAFIPWIEGSHSAVVGLPLAETADLLRGAGVPLFEEGVA